MHLNLQFTYLYNSWWNSVKINEYYNISEIQNVVSININSNYKAYYGTLKSVYFQNYNESKVYKIQGIEEPINKIIFDHYDKVYFISTSGNLYLFKEGDSYAEKINNKYSNPIQNILSMGVKKDNNFYISTNNGVYYNPSVGWQSTKIGGIEEPINKIVIDTNNNFYFIANSGNAYYLQHNWWTAVKIDTYYNLPQIKNVTDINLTSNNNVYFSTINGVFYNWSAKKIGEIKGLITKIIIDKNDNVYFN